MILMQIRQRVMLTSLISQGLRTLEALLLRRLLLRVFARLQALEIVIVVFAVLTLVLSNIKVIIGPEVFVHVLLLALPCFLSLFFEGPFLSLFHSR